MEAWKTLFDDFLKKKQPEDFRPFDRGDYLLYVDGLPRCVGIQRFLESRGIELELGSPDDSLEKETVFGLGNKKNIIFNEYLQQKGTNVFQSTVDIVVQLR